MASVDMQGIWNPGEQFDYDQNTGGYTQQPSATPSQVQPAPSAGTDWSAVEQQLKQSAGSLYDPSDLEGIRRNTSYNEPGKSLSLADAIANQQRIYDVRDPSRTSSGSQTTTRQATQSSPPQFSDPLAKALEAFAAQRAQELQNPPGGSGQALLENALRDIAAKFQGGGYTPAEQEVFQTQAIDPLERLRTARKQQVMQELSRRGITPSSGVAQSMLADVDRQFDAQRATTQRGIAAQGAQETQQRMLQAVQLLSSLAGTQEGRLDKAGQYMNVPIGLADRAWNQSFQLYNANNPLSLINPLMQLSGQQQQRTDQQGAAMADLIWSLINGMGQ
jgi:hypothetical protein